MFIPTERLLLRPAWPEDAEALHRGIADEGIVRNLIRAPWPYGRADAEQFIEIMSLEDALPRFFIFARTMGSPCLIGGIGLHRLADEVELGYWIARDRWGLGYATEAARAVVAHADALGIKKLSAGHFVDNPASGRVLIKIGFRQTGRVVSRFSAGRGGHADMVELVRDDGDAEVEQPARMDDFYGYDRLAA